MTHQDPQKNSLPTGATGHLYRFIMPAHIVELINNVDSNDQVLEGYYRLIGRIIGLMLLVAAFAIILTLTNMFGDWIGAVRGEPLQNRLELKLDGSALASYISLIFGTVVALAGSLVAIILALKSQQLSQKTHALELQAKKRETQEYARNIKVELGKFFRDIEQAFNLMRSETLRPMRGIEYLFAARYLARMIDWNEARTEREFENLSPEMERSDTQSEIQKINRVLEKAIQSSYGDSTRQQESAEAMGTDTTAGIWEEPLRREHLERAFTVLGHASLSTHKPVNAKDADWEKDTAFTLLKNYTCASKEIGASFTQFQERQTAIIEYLGAAFNSLESSGAMMDLVTENPLDYEYFCNARFQINELSRLTTPPVGSEATTDKDAHHEMMLNRYCIARIMELHQRAEYFRGNIGLNFWLIYLGLPPSSDIRVYNFEDNLLFIQRLAQSLQPFLKDREEIASFFAMETLGSPQPPASVNAGPNKTPHVPAPLIRYGVPPSVTATVPTVVKIASDIGDYLRRHDSLLSEPVTDSRSAFYFWQNACRFMLFHEKGLFTKPLLVHP